jgi:hypothetical protein
MLTTLPAMNYYANPDGITDGVGGVAGSSEGTPASSSSSSSSSPAEEAELLAATVQQLLDDHDSDGGALRSLTKHRSAACDQSSLSLPLNPSV